MHQTQPAKNQRSACCHRHEVVTWDYHAEYLEQFSEFIDRLFCLYKCKKNCCFITMCKAHSKVTHIKQQKYFHHLKRPGYNTELFYIHGPLFVFISYEMQYFLLSF